MEERKEFASVGLVPGLNRNEILVCQFAARIDSRGCVWQGGDVLTFALPVVFAQLILIFIVTRAIHFLLKPLRQSMITAYLIGGIVIGHTVLGRNKEFSELIFPIQGRVVLETLGEVGFMFHLFLLGVNMDATTVRRAGRTEFLIGVSCFAVPYALGGLVVYVLPHIVWIDDVTGQCLVFISILGALSTFPTVAGLLADLNLLNSDVGRMAASSSMISDFCTYFTSLFMGVLGLSPRFSHLSIFLSIAWAVACLILVVFAFRPVILLIGRKIPESGLMKESQFLVIVILVLLCGLLSETLGQPAALGAFMLGVIVPDGPPLGSSLVYKIDMLCTGLLLPAKFAVTGLDINLISAGSGMNAAIMESVVVLGYIGKFGGTFIPAVFAGFSITDATSLSLIMCCKGIIETAVFITMKDNAMINTEALGLLLCTMLIVTGAATPLVCYLYDPSTRYLGYRTNSIIDSDPHSELRVMVCVHNEDNVPAIINLLEISCPGRNRPIAVSVLSLSELKGRADALLLSGGKGKGKLRTSFSHSDRISNAFNGFKQRNHGYTLVQIFTSVAPYTSMHDDICTVALEKGANIVIVPFHKQVSYQGAIGVNIPAIRLVNQNVLQKAPCSVGVLIDRGKVSENASVHLGYTLLRVTALFFGGADDREALAYSSRMADHPGVNFSLAWIRNLRDKKLEEPEKSKDIEMVDKFRAMKDRIGFKEEVVIDAGDTTRVLRSLRGNCDLCIVGRYHDPTSEVTLGITEWSEFPELGVIGDMLATTDFKFSVLVVQQLPQGTTSEKGNTTLQPVRCSSVHSQSSSISHSNSSKVHQEPFSP